MMTQAAELERAIYAALNGAPDSVEAQTFVDRLTNGLVSHEWQTTGRVNERGQKNRDKLAVVVGGFMFDLLVATGRPETEGWVYRPMRTESFSDVGVSIKTFRPMVRMMAELGYVEPHEENAISSSVKTKAARWRATDKLLRIAAFRGITPANVHDHFHQRLPERPLVLRAPSRRDQKDKVRGKRIAFRQTPQTEAIEYDLKRFNVFLDGFEIDGGNHRGYTRIFNNGSSDGYSWDKGGRLYSLCHDSYQSMSKEARSLMTIDGDAVAEIDVRASYLTVLHGLSGKPFDVAEDAYDLEGLLPMPLGKELTRWAVKKWAVVVLGHGKHMTRWPDEAVEEFKSATGLVLGRVYPIREIRRAMELKHPIFKEWGSLGLSWAELMFHESEAMLGAMLELMDSDGIPSLTVHDSLIVRESDVEQAQETLRRSYRKACGIEPFLVVKPKELTAPKGVGPLSTLSVYH